MLDYGDKEAVSILEVEEKKGEETNKIGEEMNLTRRTMSTALKMYEEFDRTYAAHILLNAIKVELTENKRFLGGAIKIIMQFVRFMNNAQVIETKR